MWSKEIALHKEGTAEGYLGVDIQRKVTQITLSQSVFTKRIIKALGLDSKWSEDPQVQSTDRPSLPGSHATPTPPKCRPGANMAPINNLSICYHQYCSSAYLDYSLNLHLSSLPMGGGEPHRPGSISLNGLISLTGLASC
jgi:hypothetical protein